MTWKSILASVPFGVLAVKAGSLFNVVCTHSLPPSVARNGALIAGLGIAAILGSVGFAWNVLCIIPSETWKSPATFLVASVIDILLGITLIIGIGVQSTYVPHTQGSCSSADRWQVDGEDTNLFTFLSNIRQESAVSTCHDFFVIWVLGIVTALLSLCGAYANWVRYSRLQIKLQRPSHRHHSDYHLVFEDNCCVPPPTTHINTLIAFGVQYFQKWKIRRSFVDEQLSSDREDPKSGSHTTLPVQNMPLRHNIALAKSLQRVDTCRLEQLLSSYPIFVSVIQGLHYTDLVRLSQTSSIMYERVFGDSRPVSLSQLKLLCCDEDSRGSCWSCKALICKSCYAFCQILCTTTASHLQYCKPYCGACYYNSLYYSARRRHRVLDKCHSPSKRDIKFERLCALCTQDYRKHDVAPSIKREQREKREILKLAKERDRCNFCDARLTSSGPRWWACSSCRAGCLSHYHPAWVDDDTREHGGGGDNAVYIRGN